MTNSPQNYTITAAGIEGLTMKLRNEFVVVESGGVVEVPVRLEADPGDLKSASSVVNFTIESNTTEGLSLTESGRFLGPR